MFRIQAKAILETTLLPLLHVFQARPKSQHKKMEDFQYLGLFIVIQERLHDQANVIPSKEVTLPPRAYSLTTCTLERSSTVSLWVFLSSHPMPSTSPLPHDAKHPKTFLLVLDSSISIF